MVLSETIWSTAKDWLPVGALAVVGIGYLLGSLKRGRDEAADQAAQTAATAIAAQTAQITVQDQTIAGLRYELSSLREDLQTRSQKYTDDIARLNAQVEQLQAEVVTQTARNLELNQMPPRDQLQALAADASMVITERIGERLHSLEQGMSRLLTAGIVADIGKASREADDAAAAREEAST
jgi:HD-GYP domain-containing protein (c-di-GMP phosphodiesterase class II)